MVTCNKTKVLFLIHTLQVGGAEKILVNLVNNLDSNKYDITVMTVINTGAFRQKLNSNIKYKTIFDIKFLSKKNNTSGNLYSNGSKIKRGLAKGYQFFWRHIDCKKIYKKHIKDEYDIEVAFLEGISAKIISNSTNKNSRKIAWIHVDVLKEKKTEKFFRNAKEEASTYKKFNTVVAVSEYVKMQAIKKYKLKEEKVLAKYNPIDRQEIIKLSNEEENEIIKNKFTIVTIGRLSEQKGYDRLVKVVNRLNQEGFSFEVWIIGVGKEQQKLEQYIEDNNIENVKLLGYKSNPYKYIKKADLFVCSSRAEGFSTVVSEAIILDKPVVTTECSGMREILGKNSEYGIICENSENGLYESIKMILKDNKKLEYYREMAIRRKEIFDIKRSICSIEEMFEE